MRDPLKALEKKAMNEAAKLTPKGFTLWSTYADHECAIMAKTEYGAPSDIIIGLPKSGRWALYGREA